MNQKRLAMIGGQGFIGQEILISSNFIERYDIRVCNNLEDLEALGKWALDATLLHLAGRFYGSTNELWSSNVDLTRKVLQCFSRLGGKHIVFFSTGAVYGETLHSNGSKEIDPIKPKNLYGYSKCVAEMILDHEWGRNGKTYHILRLPNVYGKNQKKGVIFAMRQRIIDRGEVVIEGDGEQRRDFLHVTDLMNAIDRVISVKAPSGIYNISSHLTLTINQLADHLTSGINSRTIYRPDSNGLRELVLDIRKAQQHLQFEPAINTLRL